MTTRVVLVDDHEIFREGMRKLLEQQAGIEVVGEAENGRIALDLVRELAPNVVVMDVLMRSMNGVEATRSIVRDHPDVKVIALSMQCRPNVVQDILSAGASGYVLKEGAFAELVQAIRMAVGGSAVYLSPDVSQLVVSRYVRSTQRGVPPTTPQLSSREREVLQLIAEGNTNREIAELLCVSVRTVENHRSHIMSKLNARSVADLVKYAVREGLTPP